MKACRGGFHIREFIVSENFTENGIRPRALEFSDISLKFLSFMVTFFSFFTER